MSEADKNTSALCSTLYEDSVTVSDNVGTLLLNFLEGSVSMTVGLVRVHRSVTIELFLF